MFMPLTILAELVSECKHSYIELICVGNNWGGGGGGGEICYSMHKMLSSSQVYYFFVCSKALHAASLSGHASCVQLLLQVS